MLGPCMFLSAETLITILMSLLLLKEVSVTPAPSWPLGLLATFMFLASLLQPLPALAYDQPPINLGFTSFMDGGPPSGPGWYGTVYLQHYTADTLEDMPVPDPEVDVTVNLNQFIYQSHTPVLAGGKWGLDVIVPLVNTDSSPIPDNGAGLGDILVGPFLQWDPIMGETGPRFMHRIELQFILPTGEYDKDKALNPGSNFFSFNPYWAGTLFVTPRLTTSWRLHYLWNAENDDPPGPFDDTQAGQALHGNLTLAYAVLPQKLRLGLNGYFFEQIKSSEADGNDVEAPEESVWAWGPGLLWHINPDNHLFVNTYIEEGASNRPEGERINLRWVHHF